MSGVETIGELAQRTGTSRRMLRHWEAQGLLTPAAVDPWTNQRRYSLAQAGRVRAIAGLRALGFGLDAIRDLINQGLSDARLVELLRHREAELADRIAEDSTALAHVRARLHSIERSRNTIMNTLTLSSLPAMELQGLTETVGDETEIPDAVTRLLIALNLDAAALTQDVVLTYDGTTDESAILVSAALHSTHRPAGTIALPAVDRAALVQLPERPINTADVWIALDAELEASGLRAIGPYRQTLHPGGATTLAVPVGEISDCS